MFINFSIGIRKIVLILKKIATYTFLDTVYLMSITYFSLLGKKSIYLVGQQGGKNFSPGKGTSPMLPSGLVAASHDTNIGQRLYSIKKHNRQCCNNRLISIILCNLHTSPKIHEACNFPFSTISNQRLTLGMSLKGSEIFALRDCILPSDNEIYTMTKCIEENCFCGNKDKTKKIVFDIVSYMIDTSGVIIPCKVYPRHSFKGFFLQSKVAQVVGAYSLEIKVRKAYSYKIESKPVSTEHWKGGNGDYRP